MSSVSGTNSTSALNYVSANTTSKSGDKKFSLNADDFLQMFTTQIANQNPMEPMDNAEFLNQFAQITNVETMADLKNSLNALSGNMSSLVSGGKVDQATSMLGKIVNYNDSQGTSQYGYVEAVRLDANGTPRLVVNGSELDVGDVLQVINPAA